MQTDALYEVLQEEADADVEALATALVIGFGAAARWFFRRLSTMIDRPFGISS